ncbi:sensor domain-containing diguanylate cyclase [Phenylobacterium sp.]|uniref:sensor domain-containing diguanylate cyclase n=1 Tax=Phenylobacterium sp. TaxID=1871053 RepID=UPI0035B438EA
MTDAKLLDEPGRLAAVQRYSVLDTLPDPAFDRITQLVQTALKVPISAVSLVDVDRQWFKSRQGLDPAQTPRDVSFCAHAIAGRDPLVVPDALADDRFVDNPLVTGAPHIRSYLGAPLATPDGYNLGALCAIDTVPRQFDDAQREMLAALASIIVDELELRIMAQSDHLTGVLTRRSLLAAAEQALGRLRTDGEPCALILLDVDRFKAINDTYGHPVGDVVLRAVAQACREHLPPGALIGRIGGEEFAVLLPATCLEGASALAVAEALRVSLAERPIRELPAPITASFGVALGSASMESAEAWLARADVALYAAKRTGRNRSILAEAA